MSVLATPYPIGLARLNKDIAYHTDITVGRNGNEVRNALWQDPLYYFDASSGIKNRTDIALLEAFFHSVKGREKGFLLQDLTDYAIPQSGSTPQSIGTGTGSQTAFPIYKTYTDALGNTYQRYITRPAATGLAVYKAGSLQTAGTHYNYSTTTGIITFTSAPGSGQAITITLSLFYIPVRFDTDRLPIDLLFHSIDGGNIRSLADLPEVPLVEIRE